jgi:DnaJ-class molecular chaperone
MPRNACSDCNGDGKCRECFGSGVNVHVNEEEAKCRHCSGTGVCPVCKGSGRAFELEPEILDLKLNQ